uniref:Efflux RND transporter permease subunit n=1 Tax=Phenylobacterium glaciei TaxID=2803784 RepID=A0A974P2S7_9CAUL|nr:efflux RND transporter permease subunit [Phenylobacterium glaciei]
MLFVFMRNLRTVAVSFVSIPLSLLTAVIVLDWLGWTINTMTLGALPWRSAWWWMTPSSTSRTSSDGCGPGETRRPGRWC